MNLLVQLANSKYPNPQDNKYKYNPFKHIEKDYIFAAGGTNLIQQFNSVMLQQKEIADKLRAKAESTEEEPDYAI